MDELLTAKQAAKILGYSDTRIRQRIKSGELPATKDGGSWRISRADVEDQQAKTERSETKRTSPKRNEGGGEAKRTEPQSSVDFAEPERSGASFAETKRNENEFGELVSRIARLDEDKQHLRDELRDARQSLSAREELSKARIIDLERELTMRDSRTADLQAKQDTEVSDLRGQIAVLEAKVRSTLEERAEENGQLANRIADLVAAHTEVQSRVVELQPVAEQVPMLQAAVEEKDATLSQREQALQDTEQELGNMRQDIDAIASRPVTGPVFRLLTKGRLRR